MNVWFQFEGQEENMRMLENYCYWRQSACRLGEADYGGLDMMNVTMIQSESSVVCRWRLREFERGRPIRKTWWIVSKWIWRVFACHVRMLRIGINADGKSGGTG